MQAANVLRLISLVPERMPRGQSGTRFSADGSQRMDLLCRFLHWLGPLNSVSREEQQVLGVRAGGGRSLIDGDEGAEEMTDPADEPEERAEDGASRLPGAGTHIAA